MQNLNRPIRFVFFFIYFFCYLAFVLVSAFFSPVMEATAFGLNYAVWSGFALIILAFVLAIVYGWICRGDSSENKQGSQS